MERNLHTAIACRRLVTVVVALKTLLLRGAVFSGVRTNSD